MEVVGLCEEEGRRYWGREEIRDLRGWQEDSVHCKKGW